MLLNFIQYTTPFYEDKLSIFGAMAVFILVLIKMVPLAYSEIKEGTFSDYFLVVVRRVLWAYILLVNIAFMITYRLVGVKLLENDPVLLMQFNRIGDSIIMKSVSSALIAACLAMIIRFFYRRYLVTYLSSIKRKFRFNVSSDKESDIRDVIGKLEAKNFTPSEYYSLKDKVFLGLNQNNKPVYIQLDQFKETHTEIIGPTRSGKGVAMGNIAEQSIKMGDNFIMHDPKHDRFLPHIMKEAADKVGAKFIFFDLNDDYLGSWNPFGGGTRREQRTRLMWALGMGETGSDADFYKLGEKKDIDKLLKSQSWSVTSLIEALEKVAEDRQAKRAISALSEIAQISTFTPKSGKGVKWEHLLSSEEQVVIYVRGNLNDETIKKMHRLLLIELNQYIIRLDKEGKRKRHVTQLVDEVNFLTSMPLADALATIGGFKCNMILAYQSPAQLRNVPDTLTDPDVVEESIHTNCQNKIIYRMENGELAEWAASKTGKQFKTVKRLEQTKVDNVGAETWAEEGSYNKVEEYYMTSNVFLGLVQRVGVLITPGQLASLIFTSFVKTDQVNDFNAPPYLLTQEEEKEVKQEQPRGVDQKNTHSDGSKKEKKQNPTKANKDTDKKEENQSKDNQGDDFDTFEIEEEWDELF